MTPAELDRLYEQATRIGTFALLINSVVSLLTNVFLPFFIAPTYDSRSAFSGESTASGDGSEEEGTPWLNYLHIPGFTLKRAWFGSLIIFAGAMFSTVFVTTVEAATALIALAGITWAMTLWAPWAIISAEISKRDAMIRARKLRSPGRGVNSEGTSPDNRASLSAENQGSGDDEDVDQAGVILGIHNMAIAAPQIIATVGSSIIFRLWQKPRGTPGDHSIAIVLALGGGCVLIASYFVAQIKDDSSMPADAITEAEQGQAPMRDTGRPSLSRQKSSYQQLSRATQNRATLTRNKSFGGMEY